MACIVEDVTFRSACGRGKIYAKKWYRKTAYQETEYKGIVQISHDLNEHIGYYDAFAKQLAEAGYIVCANDHLGHGKSAITPLLTGYFGEQYGYLSLVQDMHTLMEMMQKKYPSLPYYFFGQGIGAYPVRLLLQEYETPVAGIILSGYTDKLPGSCWKRHLVGAVYHLKGSTSKYGFLNRLFYRPLCGNVKKTKAPWNWLSRNEQFVADFTADAACNFQLTNVGLRDIYILERKAASAALYNHFPSETAVLLLSGSEDRLTHGGSDTKRVANRLQSRANAKAEYNCYPDARHTLLQESCKEAVTDDILRWLDTVQH